MNKFHVLSTALLFTVQLAQAEIHVTVPNTDQPAEKAVAVDGQAQPAAQPIPVAPQPTKFQSHITLHTAEELKGLLIKAEKLANGETEYSTSEPIAVVLHGDEIRSFIRSNYRDNKELVDLAARLDAFRVVDMKICQRWMGANGVTEGDLPPFIDPVPWGAGEVKRLQQEEGYAFF